MKEARRRDAQERRQNDGSEAILYGGDSDDDKFDDLPECVPEPTISSGASESGPSETGASGLGGGAQGTNKDAVVKKPRAKKPTERQLHTVPVPRDCILVIVDIEHEGWGPYNSSLIQVAATVKVVEGGIVQGGDMGRFSEICLSRGVNRQVPGNKHLTDEILSAAQPESRLMGKLMEFLRAAAECILPDVGSRNQVVLVSHNVSCDVPALDAAFLRADVDTLALLKEINLVAALDTVLVSNSCTDWTDPVWAEKQGDNRAEDEAIAVAPVPDAVSTAASEHDVRQFHSSIAGTREKMTVRAKGRTSKRGELLHGLDAVYERVTGKSHGNAHDASEDVAALCECLDNRKFLERAFSPPAGVSSPGTDWVWLVERTRLQRNQFCRGWDKFSVRPTCDHGPLRPQPRELQGDERESVLHDNDEHDGWTVDFKCRQRICTVTASRDTHASFVPPPTKAPRAKVAKDKPEGAKRQSAPKDRGIPGACLCSASSWCLRSCPCHHVKKRSGKFGESQCTPACKCKHCGVSDTGLTPKAPRSHRSAIRHDVVEAGPEGALGLAGCDAMEDVGSCEDPDDSPGGASDDGSDSACQSDSDVASDGDM